VNFKEALKKVKEGVVISFDISPNAKRTEFYGYNRWRRSINIRVKAPPKGGKANKELIKFLQNTFEADVEIVSGLTSTQKSVLIKKDLESVLEILKSLLE